MGPDGLLLTLSPVFDRFLIVEVDRHVRTRWSHESLAWRASSRWLCLRLYFCHMTILRDPDSIIS